MTEHIVKSRGCSLYVQVNGQGEPLLLIHGVASDLDYFDEAGEILSSSFKVITYDRRGTSRSSIGDAGDTPAENTVDCQAEDAAAVINELADGQAIVAGCSAGGLVALKLADAHPEMVKKLFLYEAAYAVDRETLDMIADRLEALRRTVSKGKIAQSMLTFIEAIGDRDPLARDTSPAKFRQNMVNFSRFLSHEMEDFLTFPERNQGIVPQMPCFLGAGSLDRGNLFYRTVKGAADAWGMPFEEMEGCHNLAQDRPESFASWIRRNRIS